MNSTQYSSLAAANPSVAFRLASSTTGGSTVDINLPFNAFGLKAAYPFVPNSTYYFPLKRAANETQYTLGRAFLQEAYLTVDYDRGNFSVSQCTWQQSARPEVVSILAPIYTSNNTNSTTNHNPAPVSKKKTTSPAVIGAVTAVAVLAFFGAIGFWLWRWRKQQKKKKAETEATSDRTPVILKDLKETTQINGAGLDETGSVYGNHKKDPVATSMYPNHEQGNGLTIAQGELPGSDSEVHEIAAGSQPSEMGDAESRIRFELPTPLPLEMEGDSHWQPHEMPSPGA